MLVHWVLDHTPSGTAAVLLCNAPVGLWLESDAVAVASFSHDYTYDGCGRRITGFT
jgi:hypothetical protein